MITSMSARISGCPLEAASCCLEASVSSLELTICQYHRVMFLGRTIFVRSRLPGGVVFYNQRDKIDLRDVWMLFFKRTKKTRNLEAFKLRIIKRQLREVLEGEICESLVGSIRWGRHERTIEKSSRCLWFQNFSFLYMIAKFLYIGVEARVRYYRTNRRVTTGIGNYAISMSASVKQEKRIACRTGSPLPNSIVALN